MSKNDYIIIEYDENEDKPVLQIVDDDGLVLIECEIAEERIPMKNLQ